MGFVGILCRPNGGITGDHSNAIHQKRIIWTTTLIEGTVGLLRRR
jgi:hypothetical protein